jgi:hypothetical protein
MAPLVEITRVLSDPDPELLEAAFLERPLLVAIALGQETSDTYSFQLEGWVIGRRSRAVAVELTHDGKVLWQLPVEVSRPDVAAANPAIAGAELSGFYGPVGVLTMPTDFQLTLRAVLEDGTRAEVGVIEGRRELLRSSFQPTIQPLMITTLGRTGSHLLMRTLTNHPRIASYRPYQFETKVATYWIEVLRSLSEPASYLRQLSHARNLNDRRWWLGEVGEDQAIERQGRHTVPRPLPDADIEEWLGADSVKDLTAFCQSRIDGLYGRIARHFEKADASYFVEKFHPNHKVPSLMWELYPQAREIVLVRDFRDMVSSMFAFDAKRGFDGFGRLRTTSDEEHIEQLGRKGVTRLLESWRQRSNRAHLLRYEDLVLEPRRTVQDLLAYLELEATEEAADAMLGALGERSGQNEWHRTTSDPKASIGRWRHDLSEDLQEVCERALAPALDEFGYSGKTYVEA